MKSVYINPEGTVCYLPDCPEEPKCSDYVQHTHYYWQVNKFERKKREYRIALAAAKQSAVPFEDQQQGRDLICYELYGGPQIDIPWSVTVKNHSDKIFDFPSGWEVEVKESWGPFHENTFPEKVAVLIPPPTSEQKEESQEEIFDDLFSQYFKMLHEGNSMSSTGEVLREKFTITRRK